MATYIGRRLLFMIPTLFGISLLVFLLVALSPGGVSAVLTSAGGGASMQGSNAAMLEAYYEERYGLGDPVLVQYGRWLARISPIRFGARDQVLPSGDTIRVPRPPKPPPLSEWWGSSTADAERAAPPSAASSRTADESLDASPAVRLRAAERDYAQRRAALLLANAELRRALQAYAAEAGLPDATEGSVGGALRERAFRSAAPRRDLTSWARVEAAGDAARRAYDGAVAARQELTERFAERPHPAAGVPIIPGVLWIGMPDFGVSFVRNRPVIDLVLAALPVTLLLNFIAFPIIYLVAIPSGMLAASRRGSWIDVGLGAFFVALWSVPIVWAGVMAIGYLASSQGLGWFPVGGLHANDAASFPFLPRMTDEGFQRGWLLDTLWHVCLPVACLAYGGFAILSKQTRAAMLENYSADHVRTARAKGVPRRQVMLRHVFRNSLLPLITMFVGLFPAMLSGSVVVERIFSVPGMGSLAIEAIGLRDREVILANTVMIAAVNLFALLLADILYAFADPRVSYE